MERERERVMKVLLNVYLQVNKAALMKRFEQGWLMEWTESVDACLDRIRCVLNQDRGC